MFPEEQVTLNKRKITQNKTWMTLEYKVNVYKKSTERKREAKLSLEVKSTPIGDR